jgi:hypothetical protein
MGRSTEEIEGVRGEVGLNGLVIVLVVVLVLDLRRWVATSLNDSGRHQIRT